MKRDVWLLPALLLPFLGLGLARTRGLASVSAGDSSAKPGQPLAAGVGAAGERGRFWNGRGGIAPRAPERPAALEERTLPGYLLQDELRRDLLELGESDAPATASLEGGPLAELGIEQLVDDLRDDDEPGNATTAMRELRRRLRDPAQRAEIQRLLDPHVLSPDPQLRVLGTALLFLISAHDHDEGRRPPPRHELLRASVRWIDRPPRPEVVAHGEPFTYGPIVYALDHIDDVRTQLYHQVVNPRQWDSFRAASVLGASGALGTMPDIVPVLLPHLRDNWTPSDACMATQALRELGPPVIPYLLEALPRADRQQRLSIEALLLELRDPTESLREAQERSHLNLISTKYAAPAHSWHFRKSFEQYDTAGW